MGIHFQNASAACKVAPVQRDGDIDRPQGTGHMYNTHDIYINRNPAW